MAGRVWGHLPGGRWSEFATHVGIEADWNLYAPTVSATRLLYHSALDLRLPYPVLPTDTRGYSFDVLVHRDVAISKTLAGSRVSLWEGFADDVVIKEIWSGDGGLSNFWRFFHMLYQMYHATPDWVAGEYLVWRPLDRSPKVYPVDIINLMIDGEDMAPDWRGLPMWRGVAKAGEQAARDILTGKTIELHLKPRAESPPNAALFLTSGSETSETDLFVME